MKNLGKIIITLMLFMSSLEATVIAKITPNDVFSGDSTRYILTITGSNVEKPILSDICGNDITSTGSQTSIEMINGAYKKSYSLSYEFTPKKSCTVGAVGVKVDGVVEYSNSVKVNVLPRIQDLSADFVLKLESTKKELYVGEPFTLTLLLKQKRGVDAVDSKFIAPEFKGFWLKSESKPERTQDSRYVTTKLVYSLAAQREGNLTIEPAELKIASRIGVNNWGTLIPQVQWRTYYSNGLTIQAKPLPQGAKIVGNFTITADVDKIEVNPNEAVNLTLEIRGSGNFEDIESFKPFIENVNVFDEKIKLFKNALRQKIVFVSDQDFTIPSFELSYFDIQSQEIKKISTKPIKIKVKGTVSKKELKVTRSDSIQKDIVAEKNNKEVLTVKSQGYTFTLFVFILGLIIGAILVSVKNKISFKKHKKFDIKNEKTLLIKLLPYKESDEDVVALIKILENNIYSKEKLPLDKKRLKEVLKRYDIF